MPEYIEVEDLWKVRHQAETAEDLDVGIRENTVEGIILPRVHALAILAADKGEGTYKQEADALAALAAAVGETPDAG